MGRAPCCDKASVRRGPWSPQEDATLRDYLEKHGNGGNWISLPYKAGLKRCGKSCRLRWLNYLRPDIKHGGFTEEEDTIICTLYSSLGSRWSVIASHLPGRTDNDVKNYWNTKLKKKLLAGRIHSTGSYPKSSGNQNIINSDDATTNIASVSNVPHFSISDQEVDRQNYLDANSCTLAPLAELGYNQYYDTQGTILSNNTQSPLSDTVLTEFPTSGSSELKCQSFLSSQEASSWMKMESQCASWSISGSAVQDDQGVLPDFGFEPAYELLSGFEFHENFSEVA